MTLLVLARWVRALLTLGELGMLSIEGIVLYNIWKKLYALSVYWGWSNTELLRLPGLLLFICGALGLLYIEGLVTQYPESNDDTRTESSTRRRAIVARGLRRSRMGLHAVCCVLGIAMVCGAGVLDRCVLLTDYNRWIRAGMPDGPLCQRCGDSVAKAICEATVRRRCSGSQSRRCTSVLGVPSENGSVKGIEQSNGE